MTDPSFAVCKIGPESDVVLRNLFEHYMHDMAEWFAIDTQADGRYGYDTSSIWNNGHQAYLAKVGESLAGFAVIGNADAWLEGIGARDVHEFFIVRRFRRDGLGERMANFLWDQYPGPWLVRVLEANAPALAFWRKTISSYSDGSFAEEDRSVNGRPWRFFRFESRPR